MPYNGGRTGVQLFSIIIKRGFKKNFNVDSLTIFRNIIVFLRDDLNVIPVKTGVHLNTICMVYTSGFRILRPQ